MTGGWKYVYASVRGTGHIQTEVPNQDAVAVHLLPHDTLLLCVSDGAGSAAQSQVGSQLTVQAALDWVGERLSQAPLSETDGLPLILHLRGRLTGKAEELNIPVRELACTLSLAVIGADWAWYVQVGDGAIVIASLNSDLEVVFWPDNGEYANQTYFLTDVPSELVRVSLRPQVPDRVALHTDGLHNMALQLGARLPHAPFYQPLFHTLQAQPETAEAADQALTAALQAFLDTPAVNARTSDDKTLILATRTT